MDLRWETIVTNINWTFVINLVQFGLLIWALNRILYRPVTDSLERRERKIGGQLERAERRRREAEGLRAQREAQLAQAGARARALLEEARREGEALRRRQRAEAEAEALRLLTEARQEAQAFQARAREQLQAELEELARLSAERVLGRALRASEREEEEEEEEEEVRAQ